MKFQLTCQAAPEQYDVFDEKEQVGYVRLRWGVLYCLYPDFRGEKIYEHDFGDSFKGCFDNATEREWYLGLIETAIRQRIEKN